MLKRIFPKPMRRLCIALLVLYLLVIVSVFWGYDFLHLRLALIWNIFLALLPLPFAALTIWLNLKGKPFLLQLLPGLLWLFFFPNAPYMLTDLVHLTRYTLYQRGVGFLPEPTEWFGLVHLAVGILVGCTAGSLSLRMLHRTVRHRLGGAAGWLFVGAVCALSGVGIYIGRFMRFNTWDLVTRPMRLIQAIWDSLGTDTFLLYGIFAVMTLTLYLFFYWCTETSDHS